MTEKKAFRQNCPHCGKEIAITVRRKYLKLRIIKWKDFTEEKLLISSNDKAYEQVCPFCEGEIGIILPKYTKYWIDKAEDLINEECEECGEKIITREDGGQCKQCERYLHDYCGGPNEDSDLCEECRRRNE